MRTKQAFKNALMSLLLQLTLAVSGILLPRFFIALYGSPVNGLVSSISQFISYMGLVEAGIGAAGTVALYRPLAEKNQAEINGIVSAARSFYQRSGLIFAGLLAALVLLYPLVVRGEIQDSGFVRTMILVLAINGIVDYFYLGKFRVLLQADQRGYVISGFQIIGTVIMTAVSIGLMQFNCSALLVKSVAAGVYLLRSLAVGLYAKKHYPQVSFREKPNFSAFNQRWAALLHQIVGMIVNNSAVILLTLLLAQNALAEVSVYSVYNLVAYALFGLMNAISNGLGAGFGDVISRKEMDVLKRSYSSYEYAFFLIIFVTFCCMLSLLYPFVGLYSTSFTDGVVYLRWPLVILFSLSVLLQCLRLPGLTVICAAGHYKQTQGRAITEAAINISISLVLIRPLGIVGVMIATCISYLYRTTDIILYASKHFVPGTVKSSAARLLRNLIASGILVALGLWLIPTNMDGWLTWILSALVFGTVSCLVLVGINLIFEPQEFKALLQRAREILGLRP